jgi:hypothetical protein
MRKRIINLWRWGIRESPKREVEGNHVYLHTSIRNMVIYLL